MHPPPHPGSLVVDPYPDAPRHGFQGDRGASAKPVVLPAALTVAVSRETGARGGTIGRRVARILGWSVYDQELLEYMAQDGVVRQGLLENLTPAAGVWVDDHLNRLLREENLSQHPAISNLARVILALGTAGKAVLVGRGAGCILPRASTLNVRLVAPIAERVAYISQWQRLSESDAAERVRQQDLRRAEFLSTHFHCDPSNVYQYDAILNSSLLGEETCADLIALAARSRSPDTGTMS